MGKRLTFKFNNSIERYVKNSSLIRISSLSGYGNFRIDDGLRVAALFKQNECDDWYGGIDVGNYVKAFIYIDTFYGSIKVGHHSKVHLICSRCDHDVFDNNNTKVGKSSILTIKDIEKYKEYMEIQEFIKKYPRFHSEILYEKDDTIQLKVFGLPLVE